MGDLLKFGKPAMRAGPAKRGGADAPPLANHQARARLLTAGVWLFRFVRVPLFLVLYWLRMPVKFVCGAVAVPLMLAWLFSLYAYPDKTTMVWGFGFTSFAAFVAGWLYDQALMALAPQDMMQTL